MICPYCNGAGEVVHVYEGITYVMECPVCRGTCLKPVEMLIKSVYVQPIKVRQHKKSRTEFDAEVL